MCHAPCMYAGAQIQREISFGVKWRRINRTESGWFFETDRAFTTKDNVRRNLKFGWRRVCTIHVLDVRERRCGVCFDSKGKNLLVLYSLFIRFIWEPPRPLCLVMFDVFHLLFFYAIRVSNASFQ